LLFTTASASPGLLPFRPSAFFLAPEHCTNNTKVWGRLVLEEDAEARAEGRAGHYTH
jgi:hypothetical protein